VRCCVRVLRPGRMARGAARAWLAALVLLSLVLQAAAAGKKGKFLANYPMIMKFFMFWWTILVFIIMGIFIIDHVITQRWGPARADWSIEHTFRSSSAREAYWAQLVDPTAWSPEHPVLQSADVRLVRIEVSAEAEPARDGASAAPGAAEAGGPLARVSPLPLGPLRPGLGLILRHKAGSGPREGSFFCMRLCAELETPEDGVWRCLTRTVEAGEGYPLLPGTEETELELWPAAEDGSIRCRMASRAAVTSRWFRWWTKLLATSQESAKVMLEAIEREVESGKKKD